MPFVKLDTGILNSTLWVEKECRDVFITSLLMAEPFELTEPMKQLEIRSLDETDFVVPPGWYGMVMAASVGIIRHAMINQEAGLQALEKLGQPDPESRSKEFEGRRMIRVDGGFIILNYMRYRDRDYTSAERSRRYRAKKKDDALAGQKREETVAFLLSRDGPRCGICGLALGSVSTSHLDHIKPLILGGTHSLDNLQLAHAPCNNGKSGRPAAIQRHNSMPKVKPSHPNVTTSHPNVTQAEAEAEAEAEKSKSINGDSLFEQFRQAHPRSRGSQAEQVAFLDAFTKFHHWTPGREWKFTCMPPPEAAGENLIGYWLVDRAKLYAEKTSKWPADQRQYIATALNWLRDGVYNEDPKFWERAKSGPSDTAFTQPETYRERPEACIQSCGKLAPAGKRWCSPECEKAWKAWWESSPANPKNRRVTA